MTPFLFSVSNKYLVPLSFLNQFVFILLNIFRSDIIVCQFAGYHSFLPVFLARLFFKPSLIVLGGTDCVSFPSIRYGNFQKWPLSVFTELSCKLARHLAPVHESLMRSDYSYQNLYHKQQGLKAFMPSLTTPHTTIFNGYDPAKWFRNGEKRHNTFLTVSGGLNMPFTFQLKGIDLIFEVASYFPDCEFTIVGAEVNYNLPASPSNVKLIPPVKNEELIAYYSRTEFYLQLSMSEGFPNALSEAMLCECVPIVSAVGAMPDMAEGVGFILKNKNASLLTDLIKETLRSDRSNLGKQARERIQKRYPESLRGERLIALLNEMTK